LFCFFFISHHSKQNSAFILPLTLICWIALMYHPSSHYSCFSDGCDGLPDHPFASHGCCNFRLHHDGLLHSPVDNCSYGHPSPLRGESYNDAHVASADFDALLHGFPDLNSKVMSADFEAPSVAHAASANFDAPRSGISYLNASLASGH
jgi:hypothetical protein